MTSARYRYAAILTVVIFGSAVWLLGPTFSPDPAAQAQPAAAAKRTPGRIIPMPAQSVALEFDLGLKDEKATDWDGEVQVSEGRIAAMRVVRGGPKARVDGNRYVARTVSRMQKQKPVIVRPLLQVTVEASPAANVTLKTAHGTVTFALKDLAGTTAKKFLDGQVSIERQEGAVRLTGPADGPTTPDTEEDYPVLTKGPDGTIWLAYVEYQPGKPVVRDRILSGGFEELVPKGNGDCIRLVRFDGQAWQPALDATDGGLDVWRPTVAVDGKGNVLVAWAQQVNGNWDIYYRRYTPTSGTWSEITRLTQTPGSDFHVVAATDATGTVWLAWQSWQQDNFDIKLAALADDHPWKTPRVVSQSKANDWSPAIAADKKGHVYVAWDTYENGDQQSYDVQLFTVDPDRGPGTLTPLANSARFEARPHLVCDDKDRLWIVYEEGDEQWGKDYATEQFKKVSLDKNPGNGLYINRRVKVKCLADGKLMQPAGDIEQAFAGRPKQNKSLPRLAADSAGGIWVLLRHHPLPTGAGEVWDSYALRYDGKSWSTPRHLAHSSNLLDNRPALAAHASGILAVFSSDSRTNTQSRTQDDLYAALLYPDGATHAAELVASEPTPAPTLAAVHKNEADDLARIRGYRLEIGGRKLQLIRGEFHRHTEYSSHRDQDGSMEDAWRYGIDAGHLDWIGVGDHDNGFHSEYHWWQLQKVTDLFHHAPAFVGVYTYERSVVYPDGHRNVIMPRRGIRPLIRGSFDGTEEKGTPDTKLLYAYLKHFDSICASHTSGTNMGTDWRDNDPVVEPIVEIYQGHRHNYERPDAPRAISEENNIGGYRPKGYVSLAFDKGYRFGFQASSDHMSTHMSYAVVLTDDISRKGIIDAFKKRHCYAATDNIVMDVRSGDHLMGDAFTTSERPTLDIVVHGTGPIAKLHVIRDNKYVYSTEPNNAQVKLRYTDMAPQAAKTSFYYVRVEQADGNIGWASPMWVTYKP